MVQGFPAGEVDPDVVVQRPAEHVCPVGQRLLQNPQLALSFCTSEQTVPHIIRGAVHPEDPGRHTPIVHDSPVGQRNPHSPQLALSVLMSVHVEHMVRGGAQVPLPPVHTPPEQLCPVGQRLPHEPQLTGLMDTSTQTEPHIICPAPQGLVIGVSVGITGVSVTMTGVSVGMTLVSVGVTGVSSVVEASSSGMTVPPTPRAAHAPRAIEPTASIHRP